MKKLFITLLFVLSSTFSFADDDHEHKHNMVEANAPYPTLDVELIKDTKDGYNLIIQTTNFKFAPESVNQANNGNEGHAHIYINDVKYRQYSPYFHLSNNLLEKGENEIKVTLNNQSLTLVLNPDFEYILKKNYFFLHLKIYF